MQIVTLGMHRAGTSLVSSIISELGVHVGDKLLGTHPSQKWGHWEDIDFYELNMDILKAAGGNWHQVPTRTRILSVEPQFRDRIKTLTARKSKQGKFSWKDPRTCLTIPLYLPYLKEPRFVFVYRKTSDIVGSLLNRSGGTKEKWERLTRVYQESMEQETVGHPILRLNYEDLVNRANTEIWYLNKFVGGNGHVEEALKLIKRKGN